MAKPGQDLGGGLTARVEPRDGGTWAGLAGNLTEAADLSPLTRLRGPLFFDLGGIDHINSLGVRNWVHFVRDCEAAGHDVSFERCSPVMVQQISMISNFVGRRARVRSLVVPYLCPACNAEAQQVVALTPGAELAIPDGIPCPKCKTAMQVDELPEMYESLHAKLGAR